MQLGGQVEAEVRALCEYKYWIGWDGSMNVDTDTDTGRRTRRGVLRFSGRERKTSSCDKSRRIKESFEAQRMRPGAITGSLVGTNDGMKMGEKGLIWKGG